jgi:hypothetical protein
MRAVLVIEIILTGIALWISPGAVAQAQQAKESVRWEYKAVTFSSDEKEATRMLNELAGNGWEYVGPLRSPLVAFRRRFLPSSEVIIGKWNSDDPKDMGIVWEFDRQGEFSLHHPKFSFPVGGTYKILDNKYLHLRLRNPVSRPRPLQAGESGPKLYSGECEILQLDPNAIYVANGAWGKWRFTRIGSNREPPLPKEGGKR